MLELNYLKDLPIKYKNNNKKFIEAKGATLYIDNQANRYAFVEFQNKYRPFFSLILFINQYDIGGHLVKGDRHYVPVCYGNKGSFILDEPISLEKDCEGIEVEVLLVVYSGKCFASERLVSPRQVNYDFPRMDSKAPLKSEGYANELFPEIKEAPTAEIVTEPAPVASEFEPEPQEEVKADEAKEEKTLKVEDFEEAPEAEQIKVGEQVNEEVVEETTPETLEAPQEDKSREVNPLVAAYTGEPLMVEPAPKKKWNTTYTFIVIATVLGAATVFALAFYLIPYLRYLTTGY